MYFRIPFASSGTTTAIPDTQPGNGAVNWTTGYSNVYQLDPDTDPLALRIERAQFNYVLNQLTSTLKTLYENGIPPFIETSDNNGVAYSYSKDALVKRAGVVYSSNVNSNTTAPPGANWTVVDMAVFNAKAPTASPTFTGTPIAPTAAATTNSTQIATTAFVRAAMALFGVGTANAVRATNANTIVDGGMYYCINTDSGYPTPSWYSLLHVPYGDSTGGFQLAVADGLTTFWIRSKSGTVWSSWRRIYHNGDSNPIVSWGSNANGNYRVYSDGSKEIWRNVFVGGGFQTLYALPIALDVPNGAAISITPLSTVPMSDAPTATVTATSFTVFSSVSSTFSVTIRGY